MCGWAFELLRGHPVCIGMDFRRFHQRYSETVRSQPGRCIPNQPLASCKGDQPGSCQRFKGMFIKNQSAHDFECLEDCDRLTWDDSSYRSISGGRAVSISDSNTLERKIKYCEASEKTLAISHVWSHGQGGRPEKSYGFNHCLHERYASIAKLLGCTSYWIDTPCIPEDHELRAEAISNINEIFFKSKVTLVCDRDLMGIDVTEMTTDVRERLFVTLIVSDWNLRSWTLLEAFRGRDAIYLLCKDNAVVSLKEAAEVFLRDGSLDIGLLLLTAPHLLPANMKRHSQSEIESREIPSAFTGDLPSYITGYLNAEASGVLLSHREASRPGDDFVIWSLLLGEKAFEGAESFWRSREGRTVETGYLLSSAPRLGLRGLGWAPASPSVHSSADVSSKATSRLLGQGGTGSLVGKITRNGLLASWLMFDFIGSGLKSKTMCAFSDIKVGSKRFCRNNIRRIREEYIFKEFVKNTWTVTDGGV